MRKFSALLLALALAPLASHAQFFGGTARSGHWIAGKYYQIPLPGFGNSGSPILGDVALAVPLQVPYARTIDRIGAYVTTAGSAGSVLRLAIYAEAAGGGPGALIVDGGTVSSETTGGKEVTVSVTLPQGIVWLALAPQGGPVTQPVISGNYAGVPFAPTENVNSLSGNSEAVTADVSGAFPSTWSTSGFGFFVPSLGVRAQ